jgi:aminoglycoside 6-adenylyltransferase
MPASDYLQLEQRFADWALTQAAIRAVIIVGSRARLVHAADEWSDLDLVVFATETASYLNEAAWLEALGHTRLTVSNSFGKNDREWLALYDDGCKLDAAFLTIDPAATTTLQQMLGAFPYPVVLQRGVRILLDKTDTSHELRWPEIAAQRPPTAATFTTAIDHMLFDALKTAKFIRRADLWPAKQLCDGRLKQHVLQMLEWRAMTNAYDIWYEGRFIDEWADREALAALPDTFAVYDAADLQRALFSTLDLFRRLAHEVAHQLGYVYPTTADRFVVEQIQLILRETV